MAGPEETKNLAGKVLRLIQIRLATPSVEKISDIGKANYRAKTRTRRRFVGEPYGRLALAFKEVLR